ncbi:hypothetical protein EJ06DRAFT_522581 [Trichodelitschia bisporula]|uniref:Uncharacterized protein n=1 Tax=Trichodelitschia bisporula TaxID=703511 RepID=A0A6G1HSZ6_9PEZI|nr:hypothetical protein EJ06DRAFT_522581 [Trichodelitschia bisporula]
MPPPPPRPKAIPTTAPLSPSLRLPSSSPHVQKNLARLSRASLLALCAEWCSEANFPSCGPYLQPSDEDDEDDEAPYPAAASIEELHDLYKEELPTQRGTKRALLERVLESDWRHGISLRQLAMADAQWVADHADGGNHTVLNPSPPRPKNYPRRLPPRHALRLLRFTNGFLDCLRRGCGGECKGEYEGGWGAGPNVAGGWARYAGEKEKGDALDFKAGGGEEGWEEDEEDEDRIKTGTLKRLGLPASAPERKRLKKVAEGRFGPYGVPGDGKGVERFDVRIKDGFDGHDSGDAFEPSVRWSPARPGREIGKRSCGAPQLRGKATVITTTLHT